MRILSNIAFQDFGIYSIKNDFYNLIRVKSGFIKSKFLDH
jgi:hypothetical protein